MKRMKPFHIWVRRFRRRRRPARPPVGERCLLNLEVLEDRTLLSYAITDLGTVGGTESYGYAINNRALVVGGSYLACQCSEHAFLWGSGAIHDLGFPGVATALNDSGQVAGLNSGHPFVWSRQTGLTAFDVFGQANGINDEGQVVGSMGGPEPHAFLWSDGSLQDLGTLGGDLSTAIAINCRGRVVGQASAPDHSRHAFLWTQSSGMKDLGVLDTMLGGTSAATAINDEGDIVGDSSSILLGATHAVWFSRSGPVDLGTLGGISMAYGVNNLGQVVGTSNNHAFVTDLHGGPMIDLNTQIPSGTCWDLFSAKGINDAGQIVGTGQLPGYDIIHAYLLTPEDDLAPALATSESGLREVPAGDGGGTAPQRPSSDSGAPAQTIETSGASEAPAREASISRSIPVLAGERLSPAPWPDSLVDGLAGQDW